MTDERWRELMDDQGACMTMEEMAEGWHWCPEWDGLLVGPGMMELTCCFCEGLPPGIREAAQDKYNAWLERQKPEGEFL